MKEVLILIQLWVDLPRTTAQQATVGTAVTRAQLRTGDIVLFAFGSTRWTGIFVRNNTVVWASPSAGVVRRASLGWGESANCREAQRRPLGLCGHMAAGNFPRWDLRGGRGVYPCYHAWGRELR